MARATRKRLCWSSLLLVPAGLLVWQIVTGAGGTPDPTNPSTHLSHLAVVLDSGILVLREGLETILVLAVLTASMRGTNRSYRKPLAAGAGTAFVASIVTWFVAIAITDAVGKGSLDLQAATGLLAIAIATPHTTTVVRNENGVIYHETNVVPKEVEEGRGLVPAKINPVTGQPMLDASGHPLLDYDMATPNLLLHYFPTGILGLGLTALLASFMSGMAGNVTAFNTVFTYDLYQSYIHKGASDRHYLAVGRWATVGGILLSIGTAFAVISFNNILDILQLVFSIVNAPLFATFLLGMFSKRTTGHGAFAGLIAGTSAALLHHGLTLPIEARPGIHGGWIAVLHHYPSDMAQNFYGAIFAFGINFVVAVVVSLMTKPRPESELVGLVHSLTPKPPRVHDRWWKSPEALAVAILLGAIALNIFFA